MISENITKELRDIPSFVWRNNTKFMMINFIVEKIVREHVEEWAMLNVLDTNGRTHDRAIHILSDRYNYLPIAERFYKREYERGINRPPQPDDNKWVQRLQGKNY